MAKTDEDKAWELMNELAETSDRLIALMGLIYDYDVDRYVCENIPGMEEDLSEEYLSSLFTIAGM